MTAQSRLASQRNWGKGRLAGITNNLKSYGGLSCPVTKCEAEKLARAISALEDISYWWSEANQELGLKK